MKNQNFFKKLTNFPYSLVLLIMLFIVGKISANSVSDKFSGISDNTLEVSKINLKNNIKEFEEIEKYVDNLILNIKDDTIIAEVDIDTVSITMDGLDSVIVYTIDSTELNGDSIILRTVSAIDDIKIKLSGETREINPGLFGVAIEGFFRPKQTPIDNEENLEAWDWMSDLQPKMIRFPGGASGTFMHLLPYRDVEMPYEVLDPIKGYGYDIDEIIRYFDGTDLSIETDAAGYIESILVDMEDEACDDYENWMYHLNLEDLPDATMKLMFEEFYKRWKEQEDIATGENQMYITQFIKLIDKIQDEHGYIVDVILDLNVVSESAPQCKHIIEYLRDPLQNGITSVNVVGVELGNEMYFEWSKYLLGIAFFSNYWSYLNGGSVSTPYMTSVSDYAWSGYLRETSGGINIGHNYFLILKGDPEFDVKIGLPADNLQWTEEHPYAFKKANDAVTIPDWNYNLSSSIIRNSTLTVGSEIRYKFDAIILHPYYEADNNWEQFLLSPLCPVYPTDGLYSCDPISCTDYGESNWKFSSVDDRLDYSYTTLLGQTPTYYSTGGFNELIKTRYMESFNVHNAEFKFYLTTGNTKDLWMTEWNMKSQHNALDDVTEQPIVNTADNSFAHSYLIQEWWLKNLKLNFSSGYRENFFTYASFHNYGGGGASSLIYHADYSDFVNSLPPIDPDDFTGNKYLRRATYITMYLLRNIPKDDLKYIRITSTKSIVNQNVQPTVFIDIENEVLFIYYTNLKSVSQSYVLDEFELGEAFYGDEEISFGLPVLYTIDALQAYSNSGRNSLYDINACYENEEENPHPFEIQWYNVLVNSPEITEGLSADQICLTAPAYSAGYFRIPLDIEHRLKSIARHNIELFLYPNPTTNFISLYANGTSGFTNGDFEVSILNSTGIIMVSRTSKIEDRIDVSELPSGFYTVKIKNKLGAVVNLKFVKI